MSLEDHPTRFRDFIASCRSLLILGSLSFCLVMVAEPSAANDWSHWRGPFGNGIIPNASTPTHWSTTDNIRWQTSMAGPTNATPTLSGNLIFTTILLKDEHQLAAYSTTDGSLAWKRTLLAINRHAEKKASTHSAPSLVSNDELVIVTTKEGDCCCYRLDGQPLWKLSLAERLNPIQTGSSYGSTPVLHEGRLYIQWIHGDGNPLTHESMVACLDAKTGVNVWTTTRTTGARKDCEQSYASPILIDSGNRATVVSHGADYAVAHRVTDGHEIWRIGGLNPMSNYRSASPFVASPIAAEGFLILPAAKNGVVIGLDLSGQNGQMVNRGQDGSTGWGSQQWKNLTGKPRKLWHLSGGSPGTASPLIYEGLLYLCSESGELACYDVRTSETIYRRWLPKGYYHASPVLADEKIYFTSYSGEVTVVRPGRKFETLAHNFLPGPIVASPIIDRNTIYFRSYRKLFAVGAKQRQPHAELSAFAR